MKRGRAKTQPSATSKGNRHMSPTAEAKEKRKSAIGALRKPTMAAEEGKGRRAVHLPVHGRALPAAGESESEKSWSPENMRHKGREQMCWGKCIFALTYVCLYSLPVVELLRWHLSSICLTLLAIVIEMLICFFLFLGLSSSIAALVCTAPKCFESQSRKLEPFSHPVYLNKPNLIRQTWFAQ